MTSKQCWPPAAAALVFLALGLGCCTAASRADRPAPRVARAASAAADGADAPAEEQAPAPAPAGEQDGVAVYVAPPGEGLARPAVDAVESAKKSILVRADVLDEPTVVAALRAAGERGVKVTAVLSGEGVRAFESSDRSRIRRQTVRLMVDDGHWVPATAVLVVDEATVVLGSFGVGAIDPDAIEGEGPAEEFDVLVVRNKPRLARAYAAAVREHARHSTEWDAAVRLRFEKALHERRSGTGGPTAAAESESPPAGGSAGAPDEVGAEEDDDGGGFGSRGGPLPNRTGGGTRLEDGDGGAPDEAP